MHYSPNEIHKFLNTPHYGSDETGRGCLNGPVVVASVYLGEVVIPGLDDSKKLSDSARRELKEEIELNAKDVSISVISASVIDEINILQASLLGMRESYLNSRRLANVLLVDGNKSPTLEHPYKAYSIIKGDQLIPSISAASIVAKVVRDDIMTDLHEKYPQYGYLEHKGYPTSSHVAALKKFGINPSYRKSFKTIQSLQFDQLDMFGH